MKNLIKLYGILFGAIVLAIVYIFFSLEDMKKELNKNIESLFISQAKDIARNIDTILYKYLKKRDLYTLLNEDYQLRKQLEEELSVAITPIYKYIFVLYKDEEGDYRFLLDGSCEDKADFDQKLYVEKEKWNKVYQTKQAVLFRHKEIEGLWVTYLKPIIAHNKVQGIIAIDFSVNLQEQIAGSTQPLDRGFLYIFIAIAIVLLILLYQTIISIKTKKESITDPLTQAFNRHYLREFLKKVNIDRYQIMMIDIDFFKKVNDNYGHKAGDFVLKGVSEVIRSTIRQEDVLIRFGGEEFLVFIKRDDPSKKQAKIVAKRIRKNLSKKIFRYEDIEIFVTVSIGINCHPERFKKITDAIKYADEMLYVAKQTGRDKIVIANESQTSSYIQEKHFSIYDIKEALEDERLVCHYQPIYHTQTKEIKKYEALIRLIDRDGKVISPYFFLANIQNTNIYNDVTKKIIEDVFAMIRYKEVEISINLNFSDILNSAIFKIIVDELEKNKALSSWLTVELLENEWLDNVETLNKRLDILRSYGVKIAIDDFGSGYSNFYLLKQLHIDIIKIDGTLIKDIDHDATIYKMTKSIIYLAKEMGLETIAEFVHSYEVYKIVKELGATYVQGFYFSEALKKI